MPTRRSKRLVSIWHIHLKSCSQDPPDSLVGQFLQLYLQYFPHILKIQLPSSRKLKFQKMPFLLPWISLFLEEFFIPQKLSFWHDWSLFLNILLIEFNGNTFSKLKVWAWLPPKFQFWPIFMWAYWNESSKFWCTDNFLIVWNDDRQSASKFIYLINNMAPLLKVTVSISDQEPTFWMFLFTKDQDLLTLAFWI